MNEIIKYRQGQGQLPLQTKSYATPAYSRTSLTKTRICAMLMSTKGW